MAAVSLNALHVLRMSMHSAMAIVQKTATPRAHGHNRSIMCAFVLVLYSNRQLNGDDEWRYWESCVETVEWTKTESIMMARMSANEISRTLWMRVIIVQDNFFTLFSRVEKNVCECGYDIIMNYNWCFLMESEEEHSNRPKIKLAKWRRKVFQTALSGDRNTSTHFEKRLHILFENHLHFGKKMLLLHYFSTTPSLLIRSRKQWWIIDGI